MKLTKSLEMGVTTVLKKVSRKYSGISDCKWGKDSASTLPTASILDDEDLFDEDSFFPSSDDYDLPPTSPTECDDITIQIEDLASVQTDLLPRLRINVDDRATIWVDSPGGERPYL